MVTISFDSHGADSFVKEFKQKRSAAKFMEKTFDKDTINELTSASVSGMVWWQGEIQCDVPFNTFLKRPVYKVDEPDRAIKTKGKKR